jgi:DNA (cytosine-5)-methyltransferase 3A
MNVLSLFDGISCGQIALERAGIKVDKYFASEIKKQAIKVTMEHYPTTIQIGDVTKVYFREGVLYTENGNFDVGKIDLLIGGSPCQNFSLARATDRMEIDGLEGEKSKLFYEYLRLKKEINPKYFLLENVKMKKESEQQLNQYLEVEGIHINSSLVSYQNRPRIYWTNIPGVVAPNDKEINFQDFKDTDFEYCKQFKLKDTKSRRKYWHEGKGNNSATGGCANVTYAKKIKTLTRKQDRSPNSGLVEFDGFARFLTRKEIEQAQTLPVGYTDILSYNQMQDVCGDGWTIDVIAHIFSFIK